MSRKCRIAALVAMFGMALAACSPAPDADAAANDTIIEADTGAVVVRPIAGTQYGDVMGTVEDGISVFLGIPYGGDTAERRFLPAEPPASWDGVRETTDWPHSSPQTVMDGELFASWDHDPPLPESEDMLGLNVWTPGTDDAKRPVMVWLHGGGFTNGSGSSKVYQGTRLAKRGDVVVVTINHRLNMLGYLYLGGLPGGDAYPDSGNVGTLDMVMALEWVRDNIASFGGDPDNVTIFGESGGGMKVSALLAMPMAEGLFDKAIVQSGSMISGLTPDAAAQNTNDFLAAIGIDDADPIAALKALPASEIRAAVGKWSPAGGLGFMPVVDGRSLPRDPFSPDAPETARDIPMLIGTVDDEASIFVMYDREAIDAMSYEDVVARMAATMPQDGAQALVDGYRALYPDQSPKEIYITIFSDQLFTANAVEQAERKAAQGGAPAYVYLFDWDTPKMDGWPGAMHALEVGFAFDQLANSTSMVGDVEAAQPLADTMADAWISFARDGDPNTGSLPDWPAFDDEARAFMRFTLEPAVETGYFEGEKAVLSALD